MRTQTKDIQNKLTIVKALDILRDGNYRFVNNLRVNRNLFQQVNETKEEQYPFAVILSCIDSRTSAELIFDQGLGDVFSIRIAGNVVNPDILGSMEFASKISGSKIIVVLGHTQCGAIKGACDQLEMGNITGLLSKIRPAVLSETSIKTDRTSENPDFVDKVAQINVKRMVNEIPEKSPIIKEMIEKKQVGIIGAMYNIASGKVEFDEQTACGNFQFSKVPVVPYAY